LFYYFAFIYLEFIFNLDKFSDIFKFVVVVF